MMSRDARPFSVRFSTASASPAKIEASHLALRPLQTSPSTGGICRIFGYPAPRTFVNFSKDFSIEPILCPFNPAAPRSPRAGPPMANPLLEPVRIHVLSKDGMRLYLSYPPRTLTRAGPKTRHPSFLAFRLPAPLCAPPPLKERHPDSITRVTSHQV